MNHFIHQKAVNGLYMNHSTLIDPPLDCMAMHTHNDYELLYIISGDVTHVIEDRKYKLKKDDLIIVRPNQYHYIQIDSSCNYERYNLLFDPLSLGIDNIDLVPRDLEVINCRHRPIITELFKKTDYYRTVAEKEDLQKIITLLLRELFYNLTFSDIQQKQYQPENIHPLISKALTEINTNLFSIRNIDEIAGRLFVSESYLYRIFKQELKTTPQRYITEKRLHAAQSFLICGKKPTDVYSECGFSDYTSFYRSYRKLFGYSPSREGAKQGQP